MKNAVKGGVLYGLGGFAIGFGFGIARNVFLLPIFNDTLAVLMEVPLVLSLSWVLCVRSVVRMEVAHNALDRAIMGAIAFLLLIGAELLLWHVMFDYPTAAFFARYNGTAEMIGLAAQIGFALFPLIQLTTK